MRMKYATKAAIILFVLCSCQAYAINWTYVNPINPDINFTISAEPPSFSVIDLRQHAKLCREDSDYSCIVANEFGFHFPRKFDDSVRSWSVNGNQYTVVERSPRLGVLGIDNAPLLIKRSSQPKPDLYYLFSIRAGLLGFGSHDAERDSSGFFLLVGNCGFAASKDCK